MMMKKGWKGKGDEKTNKDWINESIERKIWLIDVDSRCSLNSAPLSVTVSFLSFLAGGVPLLTPLASSGRSRISEDILPKVGFRQVKVETVFKRKQNKNISQGETKTWFKLSNIQTCWQQQQEGGRGWRLLGRRRGQRKKGHRIQTTDQK